VETTGFYLTTPFSAKIGGIFKKNLLRKEKDKEKRSERAGEKAKAHFTLFIK